MTLDDSKDSATSPIITQSPPPAMQTGATASEGFSLRKTGARFAKAGMCVCHSLIAYGCSSVLRAKQGSV